MVYLARTDVKQPLPAPRVQATAAAGERSLAHPHGRPSRHPSQPHRHTVVALPFLQVLPLENCTAPRYGSQD